MSYKATAICVNSVFNSLREEYIENMDKQIKISTMTLQFKTSSFPGIDEYFNRATEDQKTFRNCVTTNFKRTPDRGHISVKVFHNKSIFMAGCTDINLAVAMIEELLPEAVVTSVAIHLMNACLRFAWDIDMLATFEALQSRECYVSYDTSIHAAINIKFVKSKIGGTILMYRTGSVVMAGFKDPNHVGLAFVFLKNLFTQVPLCSVERVRIPKILKKRGRKSNATKDAFYESLLHIA